MTPTAPPKLLIALVVGLLTVACGEPEHEHETHEYDDEGQICFGESSFPEMSDAQAPEEGEAIELTVIFNSCLSSSCSEFHETSCAIERDGTTITVNSQGSYTDTTPPDGACTADCGSLSATCQGPELEAGTYTIEHGDETWEFDVPPGDDDPACFGE